jgi:hypothetical protein
MWKSKTLKVQITFQNWSKIIFFESPLSHINEFECTWSVKKRCSLLYKKTLKILKIEIGYDLKLLLI